MTVRPLTPHRDLDTGLARSRMLMSMLSSPKLRAGLADLLSGTMPSDPSVAGPLSRLDWIDADGRVDTALVKDAADAISLMRSRQAILEVPTLDALPSDPDERVATSIRIIHLMFDRLGAERAVSEPELNAAIAMITPDAALVRRDAVDHGALERTADGARYRLASTV